MGRALALTMLVLSLPAAAGAQELKVQRTWRLAAVGLDANPRLGMPRMLERVARGIERELPGLEVSFDVERYRSYRLQGAAPQSNHDLVRKALRLAEADGLSTADYDVVFVFSPHARRNLGQSHLDATDAKGRPVRGALIHSRPFELLYEGIVDTLQGRPVPGFPAGEQVLPEPLRRLLVRLLGMGRKALRALSELPVIREALLAPTVAHELGHFLAVGDTNIRDGYQAPWLRHATGPEDNPEKHDVSCVMYKGRSARFYVEKLIAIRGRLVVFCDACREQMGCRRRPRPGGSRRRTR
jgi:hypothetical protein